MTRYLAFLRGVNVGGKGLIKMAELRDALAAAGLADVRTYIQSGNVIFESGVNDRRKLVRKIKSTIEKDLGLPVDAALFTADQWQRAIEAAPSWWGADETWKHNLLILIEPYDIEEVLADIGELKPGIEKIEPGKDVIYQSLSLEKFGRTSSGKLASKPSYQRMTVRNRNTARKLLSLLREG
jgi:uncharacterized protein (DUF1697 family)